MAPKFPPRKTATKGKRPPGLSLAQVHPLLLQMLLQRWRPVLLHFIRRRKHFLKVMPQLPQRATAATPEMRGGGGGSLWESRIWGSGFSKTPTCGSPSTKDYHRKKASWEIKGPKERGISLNTSRTGGKTSRTGMFSFQRTSGQETKMLTERDKGVLKNIAFYKSSMPTDVPDTLVNLPVTHLLTPRPPGTVPT
ncbi:hypothetical protein GWK47_012242 [Chionoecetes opilio]|uniref:Uncharacterized protein n=1 Tax=Chionoecetes opilio TaxID=41210 RepID=A0A8J5CPI7_CHIOP|nr:hypothetical protein GWK47_012242 [Chionoecetes opilio]